MYSIVLYSITTKIFIKLGHECMYFIFFFKLLYFSRIIHIIFFFEFSLMRMFYDFLGGVGVDDGVVVLVVVAMLSPNGKYNAPKSIALM